MRAAEQGQASGCKAASRRSAPPTLKGSLRPALPSPPLSVADRLANLGLLFS